MFLDEAEVFIWLDETYIYILARGPHPGGIIAIPGTHSVVLDWHTFIVVGWKVFCCSACCQCSVLRAIMLWGGVWQAEVGKSP